MRNDFCAARNLINIIKAQSLQRRDNMFSGIKICVELHVERGGRQRNRVFEFGQEIPGICVRDFCLIRTGPDAFAAVNTFVV